MSVIGPRPTLRYQVERYSDRQRRRLEVLPGITGWAQIHGRASLSVGRADRARRLVRRPPLAAHRPADPAAHAARPLRRHVQGRDRRLAVVMPAPLAHGRPGGERGAARSRSPSSPSGTPSHYPYLGPASTPASTSPYARGHPRGRRAARTGSASLVHAARLLRPRRAGDRGSARRLGIGRPAEQLAQLLNAALRRRQRRCSCWLLARVLLPGSPTVLRVERRSASSSAAPSCSRRRRCSIPQPLAIAASRLLALHARRRG